jgi:deazaflavin-dependent oxidoreductase (nitroreductase family)
MNRKNRQVIEEFRANGGVVTVRPPHGPVLLLHTKGARTGRDCLTPLIYRPDGDRYVVAASMGGWKRNPDWYYNLLANPRAFIEVGSEAFAVTAEVALGDERDRLFALHTAAYPQFDYYQRKTKRVIPIVILTPLSSLSRETK